MTDKVIALDAMGGDYGPKVVVPAALGVLKQFPDLSLILVGDRDKISSMLTKHHASETDHLKIHHSTEVVEMDEKPSHALRYKKDSSMRVAINLVHQGQAQACVSAGNTGALMATARFVLKTLPGIDRPAILGRLPTRRGTVRMVDLGANIDSTVENLFQFAVMGAVVAESVDGIARPKIGLLNIGEEEIKGNEQVKQTGQLLSQTSFINYIGYIEGSDINTGGIVDVIVCDGFIGNVAIKTSEGVSKLISHIIRRAYNKNWMTKIALFLSRNILAEVREEINPANYNGASLVGLRGIVIKSHGSAQVDGFTTAIREAISEVENQVPERISGRLSQLLQVTESQ